MAEEYSSQPRVLTPILILVGIIVVVIYTAMSLGTSDPLWFWPRFEAQAQRIVIYSRGRRTELVPGSPGYAELNAAINQSLSVLAGYYPNWGLSEASLEDARTQQRTVEVLYAEPVQIHSTFNIGRPNTILIPLSGRGADESVVFLGVNGNYWPGAPKVRGLERLQELVAQLGY